MDDKKAKKIYTVSLIGLGFRGGKTYAKYFAEHDSCFRVECVCDIDEKRANEYGDNFGIKSDCRFTSDDEFFKTKRSDVLIVSTPEKTHNRIAKKAIELGYNIFLEIPISDDPDELRELTASLSLYDKVVRVAYVLRYDAMICKLKEIIESGGIGKLVSLDYTENVVFWHDAHSFVRGNWNNTEKAMPMILLKCCHDFDIISYLIGEECGSVSSLGSLFWFKKENQPSGAADRCTDCKYVDSCVYSAKKIYIDMWKSYGLPASAAPMNIITGEYPLTDAALTEAIKTGDYGRCVFCCDNDVVDNQTVIMQFKNGTTATLKMEAFVKDGGRDIRIFGTEGEIELSERMDTLIHKRYFGKDDVYKLSEIGHKNAYLDADTKMFEDFLSEVKQNERREKAEPSNNGEFMESHFIALAAEESRRNGGSAVDLFKFRTGSSLLKNIIGYIDLHFTEKLTLSKLAREMGYTSGYCSNVLRRATGESFNDYLNRKRIQKVQELLADKTNKKNLQEVLFECGFEYSSTYYRQKNKIKFLKENKRDK